MTRPIVADIDSQSTAWDAAVNTFKDVVLSQPYPLPVHAGNETNLEATYPAAGFDQCVIWVNHSVFSWTLYVSLNSVWYLYSARETMAYRLIGGTATLGVGDKVVEFSAGSFTVTLPTATSKSGESYYLKNSSGATVTIDGDGAETIDGAATYALLAGTFVKIYSTGAAWLLI